MCARKMCQSTLIAKYKDIKGLKTGTITIMGVSNAWQGIPMSMVIALLISLRVPMNAMSLTANIAHFQTIAPNVNLVLSKSGT